MNPRTLLIPIGVLAALSACFGQQWVNPHFDAHRLDLRDLGYPRQNLIPDDDSLVTALLAHSNGFIYGATSGRDQSYLFFYNRYINKVRPLGKIGNATGVHHCMVEGKDGEIYIGTGMNMFAPVKLNKDFPVEVEAIEKQLWKDITKPYEGYVGGHIYRYDPKAGDLQEYTSEDQTPLEDLGIPIPGETIYAMTLQAGTNSIYGITYPNARFFAFDLQTKQTKDFGEILARRVYNGPERHWRTVPRALYCAAVFCYTSGDNGIVIAINVGDGKIEYTDMRLPGEYWEGLKSMDYPVIDAITSAGPSNLVFGATNDGYIFEMAPGQGKFTVLGKPRVQRRTRALAMGKDGCLYIVTGEIGKYAKLHTWSKNEGFIELGVIAVDRSPYYQKRAYNVDAMAVGPDGTVFIGESDRGGKLYLYQPPPGNVLQIFKEGYNPTNPVVERMRPGTPALIPENL